ncbi:hypothetical protein [Pedobacter insulae]|uniref:Uncharacterized protein n=1 Tax=Pedobacter insulae TaxID=414048 RepID=A0A1I2WN74_9SPHI|nr:hypothetical protein [Pedobacter insulae]SFH02127.1 hypothetical protein SAMN04489864_104139 [Pedobacter insulae]
MEQQENHNNPSGGISKDDHQLKGEGNPIEGTSADNADVNAIEDQQVKVKDSEHKEDNAANAKDTSGHYQSHKKAP